MVKKSSHLFEDKILKEYVKHIEIEPKHEIAAKEWLDLLSKTNQLEKEKLNYLNFYQTILHDLLGYSNKNLKYEEENVEYQILNDSGETIGCFELKGTSSQLRAHQDRKDEHATPLLQTKDYCATNGWRYGICTNYRNFILFDMHRGWIKEYEFDFTEILNNKDKLKEFIGIFSRENFVKKNQVDELGKNSMDVEKDIEKKFYELFHLTRLMLMTELQQNAGLEINDAKHYAQLYLNRLIFLFFAEDNGLIRDGDLFKDTIIQTLGNPSITESTHKIALEIQGLFETLKTGSPIKAIPPFNGGLFEEEIPSKINFLDLRDDSFFKQVYLRDIDSDDYDLTEKEKKILKQYRGQLNPIILNLLRMDRYDFNSVINVDILGHIFEQSLTDLEEIENLSNYEEKLKAQKSKRKRDAIYYTFDYITDYICRNTIIPYLSKSEVTHIEDLIQEYSDNLDELSEKIKTIKILDPACGSGAFLIKAADILLKIDAAIQEQKNKGKGLDQTQISKFSGTKEIAKIIQKNIYGVDINNESVEITKLSMFLRLAQGEEQLIDLSGNILEGNSLIDKPSITKTKILDWNSVFSEIHSEGGFDIIVGNPPYGAELTEIEQNFLKKKFQIKSTDTAQLMMKLSYDLLKPGGYHGFIVPKPLLYASNWEVIREYFLDDLQLLVDMGKVWEEVKLEQAVYVIKKGVKSSHYLNGKRINEHIHANYKINKKYCRQFGLFLSQISKSEQLLGEKIFSNSDRLVKYATNSRGEIYQEFANEVTGLTVMGGKQIQRYHMNGIYGYIKKQNVQSDKAYVDKKSILAQRLVAHILKPTDHIKITATIPEKDDFIIVDTINQIKITDKSVSPYFILGLLNSKICNWYAYRFIFGKAIRTMQFDNPVTNKIPIVVDKQKEIIEIVQKLMENYSSLLKLEQTFETNVKSSFNLENLISPLHNYHNLDFQSFYKLIIKLSGKEADSKTRKEWIEIFEEEKQKKLTIINKIAILESDLNQLFYDIFNLTKDEIDLIENSTPE